MFNYLEQLGIDYTDEFYPWLCTFDYESVLKALQFDEADKTRWVTEHIPVSVSICSNVLGYTDPKFFTSDYLDELIQIKMQYISEIQHQTEKLAKEKWIECFLELENIIKTFTENTEFKHEKQFYDKVRRMLSRYCKQLPVLGFNSSRYDIPLVKSKLFAYLSKKKFWMMMMMTMIIS